MQAMTRSQRSGYNTAALVIGILAFAAVMAGIVVEVEYGPFSLGYGYLGILMGVLAGAIAFAIHLTARRAPAAR